MVALRVPDAIRERLQNMLRELMVSIERIDRLYTHLDLLFENSFGVIHTLATADTRGRLKGEEADLLKKIKESNQEQIEAHRKRKEAEALKAVTMRSNDRPHYNNSGYQGGGGHGRQYGAHRPDDKPKFEGNCHNCKLPGHKAYNCRKPKK